MSLRFINGIQVETIYDTFSAAPSNKWVLYPVTAGDSVYIKAPGRYSVYYTIFTEYVNPVIGETPPYATGYSGGLTKLVALQDATITIPSDGKYLVFSPNNATVSARTLTINGVSVDELYTSDNLRERIVALEDGKLDNNFGESNAGKTLVIDSNGDVAPGNVQVAIDATLTHSGEAADAKATGDGLAGKVDKFQGANQSGKTLKIGQDGYVTNEVVNIPAIDSTLTLSGYAAEAKATGDGIAAKLNKPAGNGTNGQVLTSDGTGGTLWSNPIQPSAQDIASAVNAWLDEHPDATTTVEDGSITAAKIADTFMPYITAATLVSTLAELSAAFSAGKSVIILKSGTNFEVSSQINVPANTYIIGYSATIKRADAFDGVLLRLAKNCKIEGVSIDGNRTNTTAPTWDTTTEIRVGADGNCIIDNVWIAHGNEAIICYGDNTIVRGCKITDCGGNAIHFSGGNNTRVEDCVVIGCNKKSGMGHEDGCIIWSDQCNYITCTGNWVEDGISGFGSLDWENNDNAKIIGNTIKDCRASAIDITSAVKFPKNIIISGNHIINSKKMIVANYQSDKVMSKSIVIDDNYFYATDLDARYVDGIIISNNIFDDCYVIAIYCEHAIVKANKIDTNNATAIYCDYSNYIVIADNDVRCVQYGVRIYNANNAVVDSNIIRQKYHTNNPNEPAIKTALDAMNSSITNNKLFVYYGFGIYLFDNATVIGNSVDCAANTVKGLQLNNNRSGSVWIGNTSNGGISITPGSNSYAAGNIASTSTSFLKVTQAFTNVTSNREGACLYGDEYAFILTADDGHTLPSAITIEMGGTTLVADTGYSYNSETGECVIFKVTGAVTITANGI